MAEAWWGWPFSYRPPCFVNRSGAHLPDDWKLSCWFATLGWASKTRQPWSLHIGHHLRYGAVVRSCWWQELRADRLRETAVAVFSVQFDPVLHQCIASTICRVKITSHARPEKLFLHKVIHSVLLGVTCYYMVVWVLQVAAPSCLKCSYLNIPINKCRLDDQFFFVDGILGICLANDSHGFSAEGINSLMSQKLPWRWNSSLFWLQPPSWHVLWSVCRLCLEQWSRPWKNVYTDYSLSRTQVQRFASRVVLVFHPS